MNVRKTGKVLLYCCAGLVALMLLLVVAVTIALDRVPEYQAEIKDWVHRQTGYYIRFAHVAPAFHWYGPELYFDQIELRSQDDRRVLARAASGRIAIDLSQLFRAGKLFGERIELDAPNIVIARTGPNSFSLASEIELGGRDSSIGTLTLDDLPAGRLAIRGGFLTIVDWNAVFPQLVLEGVNLDLHRDGAGMAFTVNGRLPAQLGGTLSVAGDARGVGDLPTLSWSALVRARDISFPGLRQLFPDYLARLDTGTGAFELAARGRGRTLASVDLAFRAANFSTLLPGGTSAKFEQLDGSLTLTHVGDRWTLLGRRVHTVLAGHRDPESAFDVSWRAGDAGLLELQARASYLRIESLLPLAGLLPQQDVRDRLRDSAPTGEWTDSYLQLTRATVTDPWRLQMWASFHDAGFAPLGRAPGLRGLSGSLVGTESGGHLAIDSQGAVFAWPGQFSQPVELQTLKTTLYWKRTADALLVATPQFEMENRDAQVRGKAAWLQPADGSSPVLTLASTVENGNPASAYNYLPRELLPPSAFAWLNRAFVSGHLSHADAILQGPIRQFPFRDGSGLFLVRLGVEGMTLDYFDGWEPMKDLAVQAEFRNQGFSARLLNGRLGGLKLTAGDARFADFKTGELEIHATAASDAGDALGYLRATPLDAMAEQAFSGVEAKGPLQSKIDLFLPFKQFDQRRVLVNLHLDGVSLNRRGSSIAATEMTGDAEIEGAQVSRADIRGRVLGGVFQMSARTPRTRPLTRTQLDFRGTVSAEPLHAALSLPANVGIKGQTDWHGVLKMAPEPARERSLRLTSSLTALEIDLPQPLSKATGVAMPSWIEVQWPANSATQMRFALGSVVRGAVNLESDANGPRLSHAALMFGSGEPSFSNSQLVNIGGSVERLDLAGWLKLNTPSKTARPLTDYLRTAKLDVAQLDYLGFSFLALSLDLAASEAGLRVSVGGPNVAGTLILPGSADPAAPWNLQFDRLKFVDGPADAAAAGGAEDEDPRSIPALLFHAAQLTWDDRQFGDVHATLTKLDDGISLKQLTTTSATYSVDAKGEWRGPNAGLGHVEGKLISTDVGATLKQLGYAEVLNAKTGRMDFDMNWVGAPTAESLSEAVGHVQIALNNGQIVGLKPGAGRVLGLASVAQLPRRLALDFSDLTDKGFAFDTARGDFDLRGGNAQTDNVLVKGPAAEIGLIGRVGLKNKDYDQIAVVTGNLSSSPLPLAGFVGGPVVGAAVLLFTQVFKQPLKGLVRGYYRITGGWDNPTVERIKSAEAAAATAEAPKQK
jgi:uncharacterized protein (TIGR02099 family)